MAAYIINKIEVREDILDNPMYDPMFSVETVNKLASEGLPFRDAYKQVETIAEYKLLEKLPSDLQPAFMEIYKTDNSADDRYMRKLVKAADKLSAYIKCIEEEKAGNTEFKTAKASIGKSLDKLSEELPEVKDFVNEFLPPYGKTLDELS
jgi:5'-deoxynucleotidase